MPEHFLLGQVRIRVVEHSTGKPVSGAILRIANSHEAALGQRWGSCQVVTGRDGVAEVEFPFGFVAVALGKKSIQDGWLGADDVLKLEFEVGSRDAVPKKKWFGLW